MSIMGSGHGDQRCAVVPPTAIQLVQDALTYCANQERVTRGQPRTRSKEMEGSNATGKQVVMWYKQVVMWYKHVFKARGIAFCMLVRSNMEQWQVLPHHCMLGMGDLMCCKTLGVMILHKIKQ
jgi:hypothetical protein